MGIDKVGIDEVGINHQRGRGQGPIKCPLLQPRGPWPETNQNVHFYNQGGPGQRPTKMFTSTTKGALARDQPKCSLLQPRGPWPETGQTSTSTTKGALARDRPNVHFYNQGGPGQGPSKIPLTCILKILHTQLNNGVLE